MKRSLYLLTPKGPNWKTKTIYCSLFPLYTPNAFLLLFHKTLLQIIKHDHWHPQDWVLGTIKWACPLGKVLAQVGLKVIIQQFLPVVLPCSYVSPWISNTSKVTDFASIRGYPQTRAHSWGCAHKHTRVFSHLHRNLQKPKTFSGLNTAVHAFESTHENLRQKFPKKKYKGLFLPEPFKVSASFITTAKCSTDVLQNSALRRQWTSLRYLIKLNMLWIFKAAAINRGIYLTKRRKKNRNDYIGYMYSVQVISSIENLLTLTCFVAQH